MKNTADGSGGKTHTRSPPSPSRGHGAVPKKKVPYLEASVLLGNFFRRKDLGDLPVFDAANRAGWDLLVTIPLVEAHEA